MGTTPGQGPLSPPWREEGPESRPALTLPGAFRTQGGMYYPASWQALQRERLALSNVLLCQTEVPLFQQIPWDLE